MKFPAQLRWLWLSLAVVFLDRLTKAWIESQTTESWRHEVVRNFIYLVHSRNPGIAFSMFANSSSPALRIILIVGALIIIAVIAWLLVASSHLSALERCWTGATSRRSHRQPHRPRTSRWSNGFSGSVPWHLPVAGV